MTMSAQPLNPDMIALCYEIMNPAIDEMRKHCTWDEIVTALSQTAGDLADARSG
jgi:hypothetical protein